MSPTEMVTVPATSEHAALLLAALPAERRIRFEQRSGGQALRALVADIAASDISYCGIDGDHVATLGGVMPTGRAGCGYVWQVISDVRAHKRAYLRQGREMQARFHVLYPRLVIAIEPDYAAARRHVRRLGWRELDFIEHRGAAALVYERIAA